jgi:hypothetical protein
VLVRDYTLLSLGSKAVEYAENYFVHPQQMEKFVLLNYHNIPGEETCKYGLERPINL